MVYNEIERISELLSGHRIIIYYIEDDTSVESKLSCSVESVMEILEKKNDDLIIFKVRRSTPHFIQFKEFYMPEIKGPISLFVVNGEGIPLICEEIFNDDDICKVFDSICVRCELDSIPKNEMSKFIDESNNRLLSQTPKMAFSCESQFDSNPNIITKCSVSVGSTLTGLQIRLPDGTKDTQSFEKDALLQEVYDFIHTKYNLKSFDLKTYNHGIFSAEDYENTLQDLDLTPNGVVMVVCKNLAPFNDNGRISKLFQYGFSILFGKITPILLYVKVILYGYWNSFFSSGNNSSRRTQNQSGGSNASRGKNATTRYKKSTSNSSNIHTLRRSDDSDDENNRYNGNSTQQK